MRRNRISPAQSAIVASGGVKGSGQSCLVKQSGPLIRMDLDEIAAVIEVLKPIGPRELLEGSRKKHGATSIVTIEQDTRSPFGYDSTLQTPSLSLPEQRIVGLGKLHICFRTLLHDP